MTDGLALYRSDVILGQMDYNKKIRTRIKKLISTKKWTHYRLAKQAGLQISTVDTAVNGSGEIHYSTVMRILDALEVSK